MSAPGTRLSNCLDRNLDVLTSRPGLPWVVGCLMLSLLLIRALLFPGTGGDDGEQLIFSQFFDWGYQVRNPPLYTWLVIAVSKVTGANLWAVNIVKFTLLAAMYLFLWRACLRLFKNETMAVLAALSPVLCYYVAWEVVTGFSHTVLVACLYSALFWVLVRLRQDGGRVLDYALFGLVIGLGAMAKYAFWIFLSSLLAGSLADREVRAKLLNPRLLITVAVATIVAWPHYAWLAGHLVELSAQAGDAAAIGSDGLNFTGLGHGAKAAIGFLAPLWILTLLVFPAAYRPGPGAGADADEAGHPMARVIGLQMLIVLTGTLIGTLLLPDFRIRTHYMFVLLLFPLWLLLRVEAMNTAPRRIAAYGGIISLFLAAAPIGMVGKYLFEPFFCGRCQHHIPYTELAAKFRDAGFNGGTVVAFWHPDPLPGNLRAALPEARVISAKHPDIVPPLRLGDGQCLVVWSADARRDRKHQTVGLANRLFNAGIQADTPHKLIAAAMPVVLPWGPGKAATLGIILTEGRGTCR